jgi:anaerobic dimethyl sulfoxide reductase subunit A
MNLSLGKLSEKILKIIQFPAESGKLETYSQRLADIIESRGWSTVRPIPHTIQLKKVMRHFSDWENKIKGEYPLQLSNMHYLRDLIQYLTIFNNSDEAFPQEFFMNPIDAEERGIKHGDIVLIRSKHGQTIRPVSIYSRPSSSRICQFTSWSLGRDG